MKPIHWMIVLLAFVFVIYLLGHQAQVAKQREADKVSEAIKTCNNRAQETVGGPMELWGSPGTGNLQELYKIVFEDCMRSHGFDN